ncbi:hypothetical protein CRUP_009542, partial [Coryphaenoides rupestris]
VQRHPLDAGGRRCAPAAAAGAAGAPGVAGQRQQQEEEAAGQQGGAGAAQAAGGPGEPVLQGHRGVGGQQRRHRPVEDEQRRQQRDACGQERKERPSCIRSDTSNVGPLPPTTGPLPPRLKQKAAGLSMKRICLLRATVTQADPISIRKRLNTANMAAATFSSMRRAAARRCLATELTANAVTKPGLGTQLPPVLSRPGLGNPAAPSPLQTRTGKPSCPQSSPDLGGLGTQLPLSDDITSPSVSCCLPGVRGWNPRPAESNCTYFKFFTTGENAVMFQKTMQKGSAGGQAPRGVRLRGGSGSAGGQAPRGVRLGGQASAGGQALWGGQAPRGDGVLSNELPNQQDPVSREIAADSADVQRDHLIVQADFCDCPPEEGGTRQWSFLLRCFTSTTSTHLQLNSAQRRGDTERPAQPS